MCSAALLVSIPPSSSLHCGNPNLRAAVDAPLSASPLLLLSSWASSVCTAGLRWPTGTQHPPVFHAAGMLPWAVCFLQAANPGSAGGASESWGDGAKQLCTLVRSSQSLETWPSFQAPPVPCWLLPGSLTEPTCSSGLAGSTWTSRCLSAGQGPVPISSMRHWGSQATLGAQALTSCSNCAAPLFSYWVGCTWLLSLFINDNRASVIPKQVMARKGCARRVLLC